MTDFEALVGRTIHEVRLSGTDTIYFRVGPEEWLTYQAEGDCCSTSWFEHIAGAGLVIGREVLSAGAYEIEPTIEQKALEALADEPARDGECIQNYYYKISTLGGDMHLEMRNSSNGYYGGYITAGEGQPDPTAKLLTEDY